MPDFWHVFCALSSERDFSVNSARSAGVCEGIVQELAGIDRGDRRSQKLIAALAVDPQCSINVACGTWAETQAAYRFFDNKLVTPEEILRPHRDATVGRIREQPVVLIVQDTTELDFTDHPPQDARCLNKPNRFGLYDPAPLAVTPQGLTLGVVGGEQFDRAAESLGKSNERRCRSRSKRACGGGPVFGSRTHWRPSAPTRRSSASPIAKRTSTTSSSRPNSSSRGLAPTPNFSSGLASNAA